MSSDDRRDNEDVQTKARNMTAFVVLLCKKEGSGFPLPWCRSQYRL